MLAPFEEIAKSGSLFTDETLFLPSHGFLLGAMLGRKRGSIR